MPRSSVALMGPASSTGSPMTFMMRPSVPSPTGTAIGWPVSATSWPRTRPSVASIAMVRTVDSPRCWATSSTRRLPPFLVSSEFKIAGRWPSNWTSTTAPMTCVMRPFWLAGVAIQLSPSNKTLYLVSSVLLDRLGAGDDLDQLLGDHGLARAVVDQRLLADHLAGVAGGVVHRRHLRAVERGVVLEQSAENLHREIARQEAGQDLILFRLIFVGCGRAAIAGTLLDDQRNELLRGRHLGDHRLEARIEQGADVELAGIETCKHFLGDVVRMVEGELAHAAQIEMLDDLLLEQAAELLIALAADAEELDVFALGHQRQRALARKAHDRGVEGARQAALAGANEQQVNLVLAGARQERRRARRTRRGAGDVGDHRLHLVGIGTRSFRDGLRAAQLGRRDHLHGLGDFLRRLGGGDTHPHVF